MCVYKLSMMPNLREVYLCETRITKRGADALAKMPNLRELHADETCGREWIGRWLRDVIGLNTVVFNKIIR
jgi:hypothetical protein